MKKTILTLVILCLVMAFSITASAITIRCYNNDGKTYKVTFVCKGNYKKSTEIRAGTTSVSTNADGPCKLTLGGTTVTLNKGDKLQIKNGVPKRQ